MEIDQVHVVLLMLLVTSNLYYYSLLVNRNIDYNDDKSVDNIKKTIGIINIFVAIFVFGVIVIKLIRQKIQTSKGKLLATIFIVILGIIPVIMYLVQIISSYQNKNDAYNLLTRCQKLLNL